MAVLEEKLNRAAWFIVSEANGFLSRDGGVLASGAGLVLPGTVVGQITASKKYVPLDPTADDGSEIARAILFDAQDARVSDAKATLVTRLAEITDTGLIWPAGITETQQATATGELAVAFIILR